MARSRNGNDMEVSLFPFMSILACLIGALILMITVMSIQQSQKTGGMSRVEFDRAVSYKAMQEAQQEREQTQAKLLADIQALEEAEEELKKEERLILKLSENIAKSNAMAARGGDINDELQQERDKMIQEQKLLQNTLIPEHEAEITRLKALVAELEDIPEDPAPVIVPPGGSGLPEDAKLYFVEAGSGAIHIYDQTKRGLRIPYSDILTSSKYEDFLKQVAAQDGAPRVLFLMRSDGVDIYNKAGGIASNKFAIAIGKLPVPGFGEVNLELFAPYLGPTITISDDPDAQYGDEEAGEAATTTEATDPATETTPEPDSTPSS